MVSIVIHVASLATSGMMATIDPNKWDENYYGNGRFDDYYGGDDYGGADYSYGSGDPPKWESAEKWSGGATKKSNYKH